MVTVFESIMLICFGLSWPISVYKSATSHSTKGKSVVFTIAIMVGYIAGIIGKIVGGNLNYVLALYVINLAFVSVDFALYFSNKRREHALAFSCGE
jgi:lipopolysaccharide export LptBFGC system permease protein LptF